MKIKSVIVLLFILNYLDIQSQNTTTSWGLILSPHLSGRILNFRNTDFSIKEKIWIKDLETNKLSYEVGFFIKKSKQNWANQYGLGLNLNSGFQSKTYPLPEGKVENTPQYRFKKDVYSFHQIHIPYTICYYPIPNNKLFFALTGTVFYNFKVNRKRYTFNDLGVKGITTTFIDPQPDVPKFDFSIAASLGYEFKLNDKLTLNFAPFFRLSGLSYNSLKDTRFGDYLFLLYPTKGHIYNVGIHLGILKLKNN
jgi:hypothetical protein